MGMIMRDGIPYGGNSGSSSDTNVTQFQSSDNADYEVLLGGSADELTHTESVKKSNKLKVNPNTGDVSMTGDIKLTGTGNTWDGKNTSIKSAFDLIQPTKTATGNPVEFTDGADAQFVCLTSTIQGSQSGSGTPSPENARPFTVYAQASTTVADDDSDPTKTTTYTVSFSSYNPVYKGSVDYVNKSGIIEMWAVSLGSGSWTKYTESGGTFFSSYFPKDMRLSTEEYLCSHYAPKSGETLGDCEIEIKIRTGESFDLVIIRDDSKSDMSYSQFETWLSTNGVKLVYTLSTPYSIDFTLDAVRALKGNNYITSTTGDLTVEYITEGYQPVLDMMLDENVTQTATTDNDDYRILLSGSATNTTETTGVNKNGYLTYNPNRHALTLGQRALNSTYGSYSLSLGTGNTVSAMDTVSLGDYNTVSAEKAFAQGDGHSVTANGASAMGKSLIANHMAQHVIGMCNVEDPSTAASTSRGNYIEIVGNGAYPSGSSTPTRSNARTLDWDGNEWIAGTLTQGSSRKIKKNISNLDPNEVDKILQLNAVQFDYKQDESNDAKQRGFIAEDVAEILPCLVTNERVNSDGEIVSPASLNYIAIIPYLVEICKKQQKEIDKLKEEIARMK